MGEFNLDSDALGRVTSSIQQLAERIDKYHLKTGTTFSEISSAFTGASASMTDVAGSGDDAVQTSLDNAAGQIQSWFELLSNTAVAFEDKDLENSQMIHNAGALPTAYVIDPNNQR